MSKAENRQELFNQRFREQQRLEKEGKKKMNNNGRDPFDRMLNDISRSFRLELGEVSIPRPGDPRQQVDELQWRLAQANEKLQEQDRFLESLTEAAGTIGIVLTVEGKRGTVSANGQVIVCNIPAGAAVGDAVCMVQKSGQPLKVLKEAPRNGSVCTVTAVYDDTIEVQSGAGGRLVARCGLDVKIGDRVTVDTGQHAALKKVASAEQAFLFEKTTGVAWSDIGGLEDAKEALREAIEFPITHAHLYQGYNKSPSKGVLLYGPPGCGKTMLGKAAATALQSRSDEPGGFIYVKGPEVLSMWVGESESKVRSLFAQAKDYHARTGHCAVLFIDEAESLLGSRNAHSGHQGGGLQRTLVPAFLAEMDGLENSGAFVILSTNLPDSLDPAVTRDGRIDRKINVTRPGKEQALSIFELALNGIPCSVESPAQLLSEEVFSGRHVAAHASFHGVKVELLLDEVMSGALASGIVKRAVDLAIKRDREAGAESASGVTGCDFHEAISLAALEMRHLDWSHEMAMKAAGTIGSHVVHAAAKQHSEVN